MIFFLMIVNSCVLKMHSDFQRFHRCRPVKSLELWTLLYFQKGPQRANFYVKFSTLFQRRIKKCWNIDVESTSKFQRLSNFQRFFDNRRKFLRFSTLFRRPSKFQRRFNVEPASKMPAGTISIYLLIWESFILTRPVCIKFDWCLIILIVAFHSTGVSHQRFCWSRFSVGRQRNIKGKRKYSK